jgi:hypothetical protein
VKLFVTFSLFFVFYQLFNGPSSNPKRIALPLQTCNFKEWSPNRKSILCAQKGQVGRQKT